MMSAACGGTAPPPVPAAQPVPAEASVQADQVETVVVGALQADARGEWPSGLYAQSPLIIADGEPRANAPRFAGIGTGGEVAIGATQVSVTRSAAWAYLEYRWLSTGANQVREARATAVLAAVEGGWRIVHLHSSEVH